jgi:hypothetical protein
MEFNMSVLSSLKLVSAKRPTQMPSVQIRRNKLIGKLHHQIQLAQALSRGESDAPLRLRSVKDKYTQEVKQLELPMRVRQWWFITENGQVVLQVKYGSKVLDFTKGKNSIEVTDGIHLIKTLESIREAVLGGELDTQIESAANIVKSRFKK